MRRLLATATVLITGFPLSGCSGQSEMELGYDHCVEKLFDVPANLQDEDFGDPTEYLGYDYGVLTG